MGCIVARIAPDLTTLEPMESIARWLPFTPAAFDCERTGNSELAIWSWGAPLDHPLIRRPGRTTAIDGFNVEPSDRLGAILTQPTVPTLDTFSGSFSAMVAEPNQLVAYSSTSSEYLLYWADLGNYAVVSNNPGIVAALAGAQVDPAGSAWLVSAGYSHSGYQTFRDTHCLRPGERLTCRPALNGLAIRSEQPDMSTAFAQSRVGGRQLDDQIEHALDTACDSLSALPTSARWLLTLSGGKDSRAVAAMLHDGGLSDLLTSVVTTGRAYSPDALAAVEVARTLGLSDRHQIKSPRLQLDHGSVARSVLATMASTGCALSVFDAAGDDLLPDQLAFSGHQRMRRWRLHQLPTDTFEQFARAAATDWLDPAGIMTVAGREQLRDDRYEQLVSLRQRGVPTDRLACASNWIHRGGGWLGHLRASHHPANQYVNPLVDCSLVQLSFALPRLCSGAALIDFLLVARAGPDLVTTPFAFEAWPRELGPALRMLKRARLNPGFVPAYRVAPATAALANPHVADGSAQTLRQLAPLLRSLVHAHVDAIPYVDRVAVDNRLVEFAAGRQPGPLEAIAMLGLSTVLLSAEYGTQLFDRSRRDHIVADMERGMGALTKPATWETKVECYEAELTARDQVIASFCVENMRRAAARERARLGSAKRAATLLRAGVKRARRRNAGRPTTGSDE